MSRLAIRSPKQARSRASFERVLDAAAQLLAEDGHEGFTLVRVSKRANVSIGAIYGRFDNKKKLLRAVDQRVLAKFNREHTDVVESARRTGSTLQTIFYAILVGYSDFLWRNRSILRELMILSRVDPFIGDEGAESFRDLFTKVTGLLLENRGQIRHPAPETAANFVFDIAYGALNRHFGITNVTGKPERGNLGNLIDGLTAMCCAYLSLQPETTGSGDTKPFRTDYRVFGAT